MPNAPSAAAKPRAGNPEADGAGDEVAREGALTEEIWAMVVAATVPDRVARELLSFDRSVRPAFRLRYFDPCDAGSAPVIAWARHQTAVNVTSMLLRVAFEYGHTTWAF